MYADEKNCVGWWWFAYSGNLVIFCLFSPCIKLRVVIGSDTMVNENVSFRNIAWRNLMSSLCLYHVTSRIGPRSRLRPMLHRLRKSASKRINECEWSCLLHQSRASSSFKDWLPVDIIKEGVLDWDQLFLVCTCWLALVMPSSGFACPLPPYLFRNWSAWKIQ